MRTLFTILFFIVSNLTLFSQSESFNEDWRWVHYTTESGLPSNHIYHLVETKDGTVWVGTARGLAWYDGYEWKTVDSSMGLPEEIPTFMIRNSDNAILVVMGRRLYQGNQKGFHIIPLDNVVSAVPFENGGVLILSNLSLYLYNEGKITTYTSSEISIAGNAIKIWRTQSGRIWLLVRSGLYFWDNFRWKCKMKSGNDRFDINCIAENENRFGFISVGYPYNSRGLWEWEKDGIVILNREEHGDFIRAVDIEAGGEAVAVYFSGEIRIRRKNHWSTMVSKVLQMRYVETIQYRPNGDFWALTNEGLFLYRKSVDRWKYHRHNAGDPRNRVHEILRTRDGSLWFGTADGVDIYQPDGKMKTIRQIDGKKLFIITGLEEDNFGNIWISSGSAFGGAFRWDGIHWKHFQISEDQSEICIHKIRKDRHGKLWFLGLSKEDPLWESTQPGAYVFYDGKFERWGTEKGLLNGRVYAFAEGLDGELWFGTYGGLSRWKNGSWSHWTTNQGLKVSRIFAVAVDNENKLWFADRESGLGYLSNNKAQYLTTTNGLVNNYVWDIRVDSAGTLWIATAGGLSSYTQTKFSSYNYSSGLLNPQLWPVLPEEHQVLVGTKGSGVAILNLDEKPQHPPRIRLAQSTAEGNSVLLRWSSFAFGGQPSPEEMLTRFRINNGTWSEWSTRREAFINDLDPGEHTYTVQAKGLFGNFDPEGISAKFTIALPLYLHPWVLIPTSSLSILVVTLTMGLIIRKKRHNQSIIRSEAKFRSVAETTASAIFIFQDSRFQYCNPGIENLTGYTKQELERLSFWKLMKPNYFRSITPHGSARNLANLNPGHYEFKMTTKMGNVRWVDLTIGDVEYQTKPAKLGTAFDITDRMETEQKIMHYQNQLRTLASELSMTEEKERRYLATILHDTIGQTLAFCKMKLGEYQAVFTTDANVKPINEIRKLVDQAIRDTRAITLQLSPPILHELGLSKALEWLCEQMKDKHSITFMLEADQQTTPISDDVQLVLYQAVRELMVNIVKHAQVKIADITISKSGRHLVIQVKDEGVGFDTSGNRITNGDNGFGLFSIQERLSSLGGQFEILSRTGSGTTATLTVPFLNTGRQ